MNYDQAVNYLPVNVREYLETTRKEHALETDDPVVVGLLAQAQLTASLNRKRNGLLCVAGVATFLGMVLSGVAGVYYGRWIGWKEASSLKQSSPVNLPPFSSMAGKDILIMDTKTWKPYVWIRADKTYYFPHE